MAYVQDPKIIDLAVRAVGEVTIPSRVAGYKITEYMLSIGYRLGVMPAEGEFVVIDAYGKLRRGVVVDTARSRATVAVTTPSAIQRGGPVLVIAKVIPVGRIYTRPPEPKGWLSPFGIAQR